MSRENQSLREGISRRGFDLWVVGEGRDTEELLAMCLDSQGHRAFLVDDEATRDVDSEKLEGIDGVIVNVSSGSTEAEAAVRRIHSVRPDLGIAVMVGSGSVDLAHRLYADGASLVIEKPCDPKLLVAKIERTAARSAGNLYPESTDDRPVDRTPGMEGTLGVVDVADLLLVLSQNQNCGWLQVRRGDDRYSVAIEDGELVGAAGPDGITGRKAAFRAVRQTRGTFSYTERGALDVSERLRDSFERVDNLVLLAVQEADELPRVLDDLPEPDEKLYLDDVGREAVAEEFGEAFAKRLSPLWGSDVGATVLEVVNGSEAPDLETAKALLKVVEKGFVGTLEELEPANPLEEETSPSDESAEHPIDTPGV